MTDASPAGRPAEVAERSAVVEVRGAGKVFGADAGAVTALESIDLTIRAGEFVSLIGPSGCGKSTLLRLIGDLTAPTTGEVKVNGKPARRARLDRDYGMVFQAPVLMDWRTVTKNIELPLEIMGFERAERSRRSAALLKLVELEGFESRHPWQLSGGMQQRVAIARALAFDPKLLLMDEPFGALDEMTRERMNLEVMRIWRETGTTIVFVTHSIPEAVFLSTRVVVMSPRPGRISRIVDVDLPQPRTFETRESERYFELVTRVREALRERDGGDGTGGVDGAGGVDETTASRVRAEGYA
jgi:NitT/TauT family transport system ATP-binding protein